MNSLRPEEIQRNKFLLIKKNLFTSKSCFQFNFIDILLATKCAKAVLHIKAGNATGLDSA